MSTKTIYARTKNFLEKAKKIHGEKYDYSNMEYHNARTEIEIICPTHGSFPQRPDNHTTSNQGCPKCNGGVRKSKDEFIKDSINAHGNKYDYINVNYINNLTGVDIICEIHGVFNQIPSDHIYNAAGCPSCSKRNYSKKSIEWLNSINHNIQHAENGGEYRIPNTRYFVDGYHKETNTVYEFHGDIWHGNPDLFKPNDTPQPFNKTITAKELYDKTIQKENLIKSLGYNLIVMWENNYSL